MNPLIMQQLAADHINEMIGKADDRRGDRSGSPQPVPSRRPRTMKNEKCDMDASACLWLAQPTAREARSEAVFASTLQPSDTPTADMIASAISRAVQRLGTRGCAEKMAQEFGDHPDVAAERMRWARQLAA